MNMFARFPLILLLVATLLAPVLAHDPARPDLNKWFDTLRSGKGLCCSNSDGVSLSDVDWESIGGHYRVHVYGEWIVVPDDAVIDAPNLDGRTMVWPVRGYNNAVQIRCFMPGSMT